MNKAPKLAKSRQIKLPYYWLSAATIFVSSFLVFQVEPLISKHILPWFGGSGSVWTTALFFFMVALAVGYGYSLVLSWFSRRWQLILHAVFIVLTGALLFFHAGQWESGITPGVGQLSFGGLAPSWEVFLVLLVSIGLPFVLLSSTSTLLQYWYGVSSGKEPFSLYAVSNVGSIVGLLSYPFVFEPLFGTPLQGELWTFGFIFYALFMFAVMARFARESRRAKAAPLFSGFWGVSSRQFLMWIGVASIPIVAMLMGTDFVIGSVAAMPFLWVVPLTLYLLSFVIAFSKQWHISRRTLRFGVILSSALVIGSGFFVIPFWFTMLSAWAAIFFVAHWCHEWLYAKRPSVQGLPAFYVALAVGGVAASAGVLFIKTAVIPLSIEFTLLLLVCSLVALAWLAKQQHSLFKKPDYGLVALGCIFLCTLFLGGADIYFKTQSIVVAERNFFGPKKIIRADAGETYGQQYTLMHGVTSHGYQLTDPSFADKPGSYYSKTSGVGKAINTMQKRQEDGISVAVAGLGAGVLNAYCRPQDNFTYFEIDPQVITMAREHFTFLDSCSSDTVVEGDARLKLQEQYDAGQREAYDMIILDAYADDSVPVHLMTTEATAMYKKLLKDDGILAMHISSRYLELGPVMLGNARENNLALRYRYDQDPPDYAMTSNWVVFAKNQSVFEDMKGFSRFTDTRPVYWTDTHSALLPVLKY